MTKYRSKAQIAIDERVWTCQVCCAQMMGGPRCLSHNPTPEMREANPTRYMRMTLAPNRRDQRTTVFAQSLEAPEHESA